MPSYQRSTVQYDNPRQADSSGSGWVRNQFTRNDGHGQLGLHHVPAQHPQYHRAPNSREIIARSGQLNCHQYLSLLPSSMNSLQVIGICVWLLRQLIMLLLFLWLICPLPPSCVVHLNLVTCSSYVYMMVYRSLGQ